MADHTANLSSFFMQVPGIYDYPYQTNIHKFTTSFYFCPYACYITLLISCSLTLNTKISKTVEYKSASSQWHSKPKCRPGTTIKVPLFPHLKFAYKNLK